MKTVRNAYASNEALSAYYDGLAYKPTKASRYAHRLSVGMQAKKYKGGKAASIKASTRRVFDQYFRPLPTL